MLFSQSCLTLCDLMDCSSPGSSVCRISQARILEWVAIPCSRGSSLPRDQTQISCIAGRFFTVWAARKALIERLANLKNWQMIRFIFKDNAFTFPLHFIYRLYQFCIVEFLMIVLWNRLLILRDLMAIWQKGIIHFPQVILLINHIKQHGLRLCL